MEHLARSDAKQGSKDEEPAFERTIERTIREMT